MKDESIEKLTPQQLQGLSVKFQQYQAQAESIAQQINMLQMTIRDVETALTTIIALKDETESKETLVPIGFGTFVNATLSKTDKVVLGIGAGVSVEKKLEEAQPFLEKRKEELTRYHEQLNNSMTKLGQEMQNIQTIAQKYEQSQRGKQAKGPMHAK